MAAFFLLVAPLPTNVRRRALVFLSENAIMAQIQVGLKFTFFFILILFADSVNRVYRVQQEIAAAHEGTGPLSGNLLHGDRNEVQVRRFYSQRNMYLCGFTLFLSHILDRTYALVWELVEVRQQLSEKEAEAAAASKKKKVDSLDEKDDLETLRETIKQKELDIEQLKKQSDGLSKEYYKISDELNEKTGLAVSDMKSN